MESTIKEQMPIETFNEINRLAESIVQYAQKGGRSTVAQKGVVKATHNIYNLAEELVLGQGSTRVFGHNHFPYRKYVGCVRDELKLARSLDEALIQNARGLPQVMEEVTRKLKNCGHIPEEMDTKSAVLGLLRMGVDMHGVEAVTGKRLPTIYIKRRPTIYGWNLNMSLDGPVPERDNSLISLKRSNRVGRILTGNTYSGVIRRNGKAFSLKMPNEDVARYCTQPTS